MKQRIIKLEKITDNKWLNLFKVQYINSKKNLCEWIFASRKNAPFKDNDVPDAVVIAATVDTPEGKKVVIIKEYRLSINGYEYGFPAGLIDFDKDLQFIIKNELKQETGLNVKKIIGKSPTLISSAGMSDESVVMIFVEAEGEISNKYQEDTEDIEAYLYDIKDVQKLLLSGEKIGAKAWGVLFYYSQIGKIV